MSLYLFNIMIENMFQQQANARFKLQWANLSCCFCLISSNSRDDLNFDIIEQERFHNQTMLQWWEMTALTSVMKRKTFVTKWNLNTEKSALFRLFSALNIILTRSSDSAHFEYTDLCKQLHHLLLEVILTSIATQSYAIILCKWSFALRFARI